MEWVACDLCGQDSAEKVSEQSDKLHGTTDERFTVVRCRGCGLHYTNPRPAPSEIGRYYSAHYSFHAAAAWWRKYAESMLDRIAMSPLACVADFLPPLARRLAARVRPRMVDPVLSYIHSGACDSFLDIGCGAGVHAHFWGHASSLQACKKQVAAAGIEISEVARRALAEQGIDNWATIHDVPQDRRFSLIRMNWSLEHVHTPDAYFSFISARLLPGGRAVIAVPNQDGLIYRIAPDCLELPVHLYHFRLRDMEAYGGRHGLRIIQSETFSYPGMFAQAARVEMLPTSFLTVENLSKARKMQDVLRMFDVAGMGNDLLVVLEKSSVSP